MRQNTSDILVQNRSDILLPLLYIGLVQYITAAESNSIQCVKPFVPSFHFYHYQSDESVCQLRVFSLVYFIIFVSFLVDTPILLMQII